MKDAGPSPALRRINVYVGNLGSGKTELAINTALLLARKWPVALVDLDVVNPYYRTRYAKERLERPGLEVIAPPLELVRADVPALPAAILGVFTGKDRFGVFDVGGDDIGATVLGRFRERLLANDHAVFFVVNVFRPRTRTLDEIIRMLRSIESASRVRAHYLVNNSNLGEATDLSTVAEGHRLVAEVSETVGIPIAFVSVREDLADPVRGLALGVPVVPLDLYMRPPWEA